MAHGRLKSRNKKTSKYYNCGKKGHLEKDYWNLKNSNPQRNTASTSDDRNVLCCETMMTIGSMKRFVDIWLIDSATTFHITFRKE